MKGDVYGFWWWGLERVFDISMILYLCMFQECLPFDMYLFAFVLLSKSRRYHQIWTPCFLCMEHITSKPTKLFFTTTNSVHCSNFQCSFNVHPRFYMHTLWDTQTHQLLPTTIYNSIYLKFKESSITIKRLYSLQIPKVDSNIYFVQSCIWNSLELHTHIIHIK